MAALRAGVVRTGRGPLGRLWPPAHRLLARLAFRAVRPPRDSALYVVGSFAEGDPVPGLSDLDLCLVAPDAGGAHSVELHARWKRLARGALGRHVDMEFAEQAELAAAERSAPSNAPAVDPPPVAFAESAAGDPGWLRVRPGPFEPLSSWRLVRGPERRPAPRGKQPREAIAWAELDALWRHAFELVADPSGLYAPYMAVKLVSDSARAWLWLERGERVASRTQALRRALDLVPEAERPLRAALAAHARLGTTEAAELGPALDGLALFTERVASAFAAAATTEVALTGDRSGALPLADWKGVALPGSIGDRFAALDGDPADLPAVAAALSAERDGVWRALRRGPLVVLPAVQLAPGLVLFARFRSVMRSVKCPATDPVVLALLDGSSTAAFRELPGFSARETARRAVAEHRAWRAAGGDDEAGLLSAARAGLFAAALEAGAPELLLDEAAVRARVGIEPGDRQGLEAAADRLIPAVGR